jgi:hypothetical protein
MCALAREGPDPSLPLNDNDGSNNGAVRGHPLPLQSNSAVISAKVAFCRLHYRRCCRLTERGLITITTRRHWT